MKQFHVIGAGLAGLAAALSLTASGRSVVLHEAAPVAGGRCRSYFDNTLGLRIDNGNHLMLSGNVAVRDYINEIGAGAAIASARRAVFPFVDLRTHERWVVRPNAGRIPWWIFQPGRRVPGTRLSDYLGLARIVRFRNDTTVADSMRRGRLYWRLLEPLAIAALNTAPQDGLARLLGAVMSETLLRGGQACKPMLPKRNLSDALIDPAIETLRSRGADIRFNGRISGLTITDKRVSELRRPDGVIAVGPGDAVIPAVPPWVAADLLPGLTAPDAFESILNVHFGFTADSAGPIQEAGFIGVISGVAEWVFLKPGHVSVTISAANRRVDEASETIASLVWPDVVDALGLPEAMKNAMPTYRVVKEKRATFAATAQQDLLRPDARTDLAENVAIAGDWTNTGLPATIEGAIRSGRRAATVALAL